jgi:hypothetical protein
LGGRQAAAAQRDALTGRISIIQHGHRNAVRPLDYGSLAFEDHRPDRLPEALVALQKWLEKWFEEQGIKVEGRE